MIIDRIKNLINDIYYIDVDTITEEQIELFKFEVKGLTLKEEKVIVERYGLLDDKPKTFKEISDIYEVTPQAIWQVHNRAIKKLKHPSRRKHIFIK